MRKISLKGLRKKARRIFAKWIVSRDKGICVICGKPGNQAGHFIHKDCLDFDERANNCQCVYCNHFRSGALREYTLFMLDRYGREVVNEVERLSRQVRKFSREELENIIIKYKEGR